MNSGISHPICATVDGNLCLIEADAELRRLHLRAGGSDESPLAISALANFVRQCLGFGAKLSRALYISDGEQQFRIWAEAEPISTGARLRITSWQSVGAYESTNRFGPHVVSTPTISLADRAHTFIIQLDSALNIRGHSALTHRYAEDFPMGQPLTRAFIIEDEDNPTTLPLLSSVAERMAFSEKPVTARQSRRSYRVSGQPLWDANRSFAGYACTLQLVGDPMPITNSNGVIGITGGHFGRELAPVLRQPVGRIIANAETIAAKLHGSLREGYAAYAGDIANAARHLQSLIDDMSDLEAVESDSFQPAHDPIDLADVARRVVGLLGVKASDHHIRLIAPDDSVSVPAIGEFRRVLQIVLNLVSNAIRYSPDGSTVELRTAMEGDVAILRVIDQGAGIAEQDRERIFTKFERLGRHDDGGSGLGLYISRRIAAALQGSLLVENSGPEGSTFRLNLPARP